MLREKTSSTDLQVEPLMLTRAAGHLPTTKNIEIHMFAYKDEEEDPQKRGPTIYLIQDLINLN